MSWSVCATCCSFLFFNDTATTEIYTLSLHDALPISRGYRIGDRCHRRYLGCAFSRSRDRKSTRLNSSHVKISYAVSCLKKKKRRLSPIRPRTTRKLYCRLNHEKY